jgi:flavin reductase (DIM6/NTAB) family NADH-FMN oxidoreductase RutF
MVKTVTEDIGEFYQHYPKVAAVLTVRASERKNAMAVAWHSSISFKPPLYGVSIAPKRYTYQLLLESGEFALNFLPFEWVELIASVGGSAGKEIDKFRKFGIAEEKPLKTGAPILKDAYAAYECRMVDNREYGDHVWVVGEIVAVHFARELLTPKGTLDLSRVSPALYMGAELYATVDRGSVKFLDREVCARR